MELLRWGLIGCGDIARKRVAPALRDLDSCDFVAVNRARYDQAEAFARQFGARRWYRSWEELLADDEIGVVYIATPVSLHAEQAIAAAAAGKHVLCEKPMALNTAECDRMIAAAQANGVTLGVAYYRHFYPVVKRIKEIIASGEVGRIVMAQVNAFEWFDCQPGEPRYWLLTREQGGGGPMMDFGCHRIEVLLNILGPVSSVRGMMGRVLLEREVEDTAVACFQFKQGTHAVLSVTHGAFEPQDTLHLFGSKGSVHVPVLNDGALTVKTTTGERSENHPCHPNFHQPLIEDFTQAILTGRAPKVDGTTGREVARLEEEIYGG